MKTMLGIALGIVAVGVLTAGRAEAQTACGYGVVCVYTVPVGAPAPALVPAPGAPGAQVLDPELAAPRLAPATHTRPRWGLLISGMSMLVGGYAFSLALDDTDGSIGWSLLPIAGPFVSMTEGWNMLAFPLFVVAGALQIAGAVLTIVGAASRVEVPSDEPPSVTVVPYASGDGAGLAASARF